MSGMLLKLDGEKIDDIWIDDNGMFEQYDTITIDIGNGLQSFKVCEVHHEGLIIDILH